MIDILHCPDHGGTKTVVAAGPTLTAALHMHNPSNDEHVCILISNIAEPHLTTFPGTTADETVIADSDAWLVYLEKYVP